MNKYNKFEQSTYTMENKLMIDRKVIERYIEKLINLGLLNKIKSTKEKGSNTYTINEDKIISIDTFSIDELSEMNHTRNGRIKKKFKKEVINEPVADEIKISIEPEDKQEVKEEILNPQITNEMEVVEVNKPNFTFEYDYSVSPSFNFRLYLIYNKIEVDMVSMFNGSTEKDENYELYLDKYTELSTKFKQDYSVEIQKYTINKK